MIKKDSDKYRFAEGSRSAMIRAAQSAANLAKQHNQPLLLWEDGHLVRIKPKDLASLPEQTPRLKASDKPYFTD